MNLNYLISSGFIYSVFAINDTQELFGKFENQLFYPFENELDRDKYHGSSQAFHIDITKKFNVTEIESNHQLILDEENSFVK